MTEKEISYISKLRKGKIKDELLGTWKWEGNKGIPHPLWSMINACFPPPIPWNSISAVERKQVISAAKILHNNNIPYSFYTSFLKRFGKSNLHRKSVLLITGFKQKESGGYPILADFIQLTNTLVEYYDKNPVIIKILDLLYSRFKDAYKMGIIRMVYTANLISDILLKNQKPIDILEDIGKEKNLNSALNCVGMQRNKETIFKNDKGRESYSAKELIKEMRVRKKEIEGKIDPTLNKYFNKNSTLNIRGIKLIRGN